MHRSIKSTLSLLIALAPVAGASAIRSEVTRTGRPPLTQPANICSLGPVMPSYPRAHSSGSESPRRWWEKEDKMLGWTFSLLFSPRTGQQIYCTQGEGEGDKSVGRERRGQQGLGGRGWGRGREGGGGKGKVEVEK